jgi:hypothetical protein
MARRLIHVARVPGGGLVFSLRRYGRLTIDDDRLEKLRLRLPGSTGRPRKGNRKGGLKKIGAMLGVSTATVARRPRIIAERDE